MVSSSLKINSFYIYGARKKNPGILFAKKYSNSSEWNSFESFNVVKVNISIEDFVKSTRSMFESYEKVKILLVDGGESNRQENALAISDR